MSVLLSRSTLMWTEQRGCPIVGLVVKGINWQRHSGRVHVSPISSYGVRNASWTTDVNVLKCTFRQSGTKNCSACRIGKNGAGDLSEIQLSVSSPQLILPRVKGYISGIVNDRHIVYNLYGTCATCCLVFVNICTY